MKIATATILLLLAVVLVSSAIYARSIETLSARVTHLEAECAIKSEALGQANVTVMDLEEALEAKPKVVTRTVTKRVPVYMTRAQMIEELELDQMSYDELSSLHAQGIGLGRIYVSP